MYLGFFIAALVGAMQGSFIQPMTMAKNWKWEHYWFVFAFLGMLLFNVLIAFSILPNLFDIFSDVPVKTLITLIFIGIIWGVGSILFGKGMELLGFTLGYPVIMGTTAGFGTLIPALIYQPEIFHRFQGLALIFGVGLSVAGIIICTRATKIKEMTGESTGSGKPSKNLLSSVIVGILAGVICSAPSWASAVSRQITAVAVEHGARPALVDGVVWCILFSTGALSNFAYCIYLMRRNKSFSELRNKFWARNYLLVALGSLIWIASLYLYGIGAALMGNLGFALGWAVMIVVSIVLGNLIGILKGEWRGASTYSKRLLAIGLGILVLSIGIITFVK